MNATAHQPARTLLEALQQLRFDQPLAADDYELLRRVDRSEDAALLPERDRDRIRKLLYYGALLEYNNFWWRSHPVVRTLPAYRMVLPGGLDAPA